MSVSSERLANKFPALGRNQADLKAIERSETYRTIAPHIINPRPEIPDADAHRFDKIDPLNWPC